jgi:cytochrome c biogenesis protein CcmG/thiol:disulfide interchange protein DsbE
VTTAAVARGEANALPQRWLVIGAVMPLLLLVGWAAVLVARSSPAGGAQIGQPAPDFALADLNGNPIRLADLRGRPVIVNFWASWCGPCVEEFPLLRSAQAAHRADGLTVLGVVFRDNSEAARAFMARMDAVWPAAMDPGEQVAQQYGIHGPPESFFIDSAGVVRGRQIGQLSASDLERQLALILASTPQEEVR